MIEIEIEDEAWREVFDVEAWAGRAADAALAASGGTGDATVLLAADDAVADLNAAFRGKGGATNVLSFPAAASARPHLGDLALAHGVCAREAQAQGKTLADHLAHLVVHGMLHLLGHDHEAEAEAEAMEAREREILAGLGVADPYAVEGAHA